MTERIEMEEALVELIRLASTNLPPDQIAALEQAAQREPEGSMARKTFEMMLRNAAAASESSIPTCQDTGTLLFYVDAGPEVRQRALTEQIEAAVREATSRTYLRPNAVDSLTGKNSGDNIGTGSPYVHFEQRDQPGIAVRLMLKGGGSENVGHQYTLPDGELGAGRDMEGVRRCVVDAVFKAQGFGCAPGVIGVGVGGDRMSSFLASKVSLFRKVDDRHSDPEIAAFESRLLEECNALGIGPMGFGGATTALGVKVSFRHRVPASFFVSVTYMCWANRKAMMSYRDGVAEFEQ